MTQLQKLETNLTDAQAKAAAAQAALVANPENRDLAIDKLQADAAVENTTKALQTERDRLDAEQREELEQERSRLLAEIADGADAAMVADEVELRTALANLYVERGRRLDEANAKRDRVCQINAELSPGVVTSGPPAPTAPHQIRAAVEDQLKQTIVELREQVAPTSHSFYSFVKDFSLPRD